jgi:hypothetical protein
MVAERFEAVRRPKLQLNAIDQVYDLGARIQIVNLIVAAGL